MQSSFLGIGVYRFRIPNPHRHSDIAKGSDQLKRPKERWLIPNINLYSFGSIFSRGFLTNDTQISNSMKIILKKLLPTYSVVKFWKFDIW